MTLFCPDIPGAGKTILVSIVRLPGRGILCKVAQRLMSVKVTIYISEPDKNNALAKARKGTAVLHLTDIFGLAHV